ncbi:copper resistance protein CopC [Streptomyces sp. NBC_00006]|uniref:copper resistance CopC/CopD family protein n=1 Tax=Streptomyces sp. NBC_00006 TaxID=2975619 RepID=UPI00224CFD22|nr:copper resistance protein CopC [Streptomyces sp. NBC_00006]MCX5532456.1 copper resistance protein CopC [Streptomyces sp. NBC_00006]
MKTIAPRTWQLVLLFLAVTGALLAGAAPASAHAALTGSDPKQGAVVDTAPKKVSLTFSESVAISDGAVRVLDPAGKRVDDGKVAHSGGTTYTVGVHSGLPDGTFTVAYQVVSADSHPVAGAYTFSIGAPSKTTAVVADQNAGGGVVGVIYGIARYVSYAGFALLVGGAAFVLGCWRRGAGSKPVQRVVVGAWTALTAATLAMLLLRGSYTGSGKFGDIFDMSLLGQVLQTKTGAALTSRLLLLAAAALFIAVLFGAYAKKNEEDGEGGEEGKDGRDAKAKERNDLTFGLSVGGAVVAAGLAATWAMAEHASTGIQAALAMPVDVLHLLAVAAWLGGLTTLLVALYRVPTIEGSAVRRFSRVAFCSVLVLVATGLYQSWRQVGSWSALTGTAYGQLLMVKVGLVAVLVGVAWISRKWTARLTETVAAAPVAQEQASEVSEEKEPVSVAAAGGKGATPERAAQLARQRAAMASAREKRVRDADPHRFGLRRSVLVEAGIAVVLLAVTTVLTSTEPGRTEEEAKSATSAAQAQTGPLSLKIPFDTGGADGKGTALLEMDPGRTGNNEMHLYIERPNGKAFDVPEVKLALTQEAKKIGPLPVVPDHIATGHWTASGVQIPVAGDWKVALTVRTSDIDQITINKNAKIG